MAAESFPRVALYFENSILAPDLPLLSAASAVVTKLDRDGPRASVDSPHGFTMNWAGSALLDGAPWAALNGQEIIIPAGKHTLEPAPSKDSPRLTSFNGDIHSAAGSGKRIEIAYSSSSRALATLDCEAAQLSIDGKPFTVTEAGNTLLLPAGDRRAVVICK